MKLTIAAFQTKYGSINIVTHDEDGKCWADDDADYARLTKTLEVELEDLAHEQFVTARLKTLDAHEEKIKDDFHRAIAGIKDQREKLLALPDHVTESV
jgi:hypothetical protein